MTDRPDTCWRTPVGWISLAGSSKGIRELSLRRERPDARCPEADPALPLELLLVARRQIDEYFAGERRAFDLPLVYPSWSAFALRVLAALARVPFAATITYGELASQAGYPGAARAVGGVMARNPFPLLLPCHRVVGAGGRLTGYSGGAGLASKEWLLLFEEEMVRKSKFIA